MRTAMCVLNGQLRPVVVRDESVSAATRKVERSDRDDPSHIAAPFAGVVNITVAGVSLLEIWGRSDLVSARSPVEDLF
jgi:pyruvate carboxylase